jgi:hypothetical protein
MLPCRQDKVADVEIETERRLGSLDSRLVRSYSDHVTMMVRGHPRPILGKHAASLWLGVGRFKQQQ